MNYVEPLLLLLLRCWAPNIHSAHKTNVFPIYILAQPGQFLVTEHVTKLWQEVFAVKGVKL